MSRDENSNEKLIDIESIERVLSAMTLDEKLYMLTGGSGFGTKAIPRLGIPAAMMVDSAAGINLGQYFGDLYSRVRIREGQPFKSLAGVTDTETIGEILRCLTAGKELTGKFEEIYSQIQDEQSKITVTEGFPTCFPTGILMGSTWNPDVVEECGRALGREADSYGINVLLGSPDVNIQRDPRGGRVFECYTEDPYLMSRLAPAMVRGVQSQGVFANAKHFAANNQETARLSIDENISERALREIYLPGFKACVEDGGLKTMMCAYNRINGVGCSMNKWLIEDVLRGEWGFDGIVMSDWGGVYDQVEAIKAGNDLDMPGIRDMTPLKEALQNGNLKEEEIDNCVRRVLRFIAENPSLARKERPEMDRDQSRSAAYNAAAEGIVLLKNNGVLPIRSKEKIAVFGAGSRQFIITGQQSSRVFTYKYPRLAEELSGRIGVENIEIDAVSDETRYMILAVQSEGSEGRDREDLGISEDQRTMLEEALEIAKETGIPAILVLNIAAPVDISEYVDRADAILVVFYPGIEGARALTDILFGKVVPSGHLSITYPKRIEDSPAYGFFPGKNHLALYNEDIYVGYRSYDLKKIEPLFPFGHGLSYSKFRLSGLRAAKNEINMDNNEEVVLYADVENIGAYDAKATIQIYLRHESAVLPRPIRELKEFRKTFLKAGEKKTVEFHIKTRQMSSFDPRFQEWITEEGIYIFEAGFSSRDLQQNVEIKVKGHTPYDFGERTPLKKIMQNSTAYGILLKWLSGFEVSHEDFADCLKYFPDKELEVIFDELIVNKQLDKENPAYHQAIDNIYRELAQLSVV